MKHVIWGMLGWWVLSCTTGAGAMPPTASVAEARVNPQPEIPAKSVLNVRWLGGPTATLERGGFALLTDPMLGPRTEAAFTLPKHPSSGVVNAPIARYTAPPELDALALSAVLISHTHNDHFDVTAQQTLPKSLPVVVAAAGADKVRAAGFTDVRALDWGQKLTLTKGQNTLNVLAVPAHHAHDAQLDHDLGKGNGYVLEWRDAQGSFRAYWTGDAVLSDDSKAFPEQYGSIDLLLPHVGGVGGDGGLGLRTMNAEEVLGLVKRVQPKWVIPIHHTTFAHYREPIVALEQQSAESKLFERFRFLREGERVSISN